MISSPPILGLGMGNKILKKIKKIKKTGTWEKDLMFCSLPDVQIEGDGEL